MDSKGSLLSKIVSFKIGRLEFEMGNRLAASNKVSGRSAPRVNNRDAFGL
jgi:hypothetical protein